jgi:3-oxoacyl-[acyl-carrier-protein] synthase II
MSYLIRGLGALSALGESVEEHRESLLSQRYAFRPLGELLTGDFAHVPASWITPRKLLRNRKWSPAAMAALHVAKQAVEQARWSRDDLHDAVLMLGTSRGGAAGWLEPWPERRGFPIMQASNSMHGEAAAAVSIELGIRGSYQVVSTGCSAGIDALGMAAMHLQCGMARRALIIAVDLPLVKLLLDSYQSAGILSRDGTNDPYHPQTTGIFPAEAAAAMTLEIDETSPGVRMCGYLANSDAKDALSLSPESGQLVALMRHARKRFGEPVAICPHATGTASHALAEPHCLSETFSSSTPSLHLLKPYLGHGIGAGSLLETVILSDFLERGELPPNLPHLHAPDRFVVPDQVLPCRGPVWKMAASLGGHNALVVLRPHESS